MKNKSKSLILIILLVALIAVVYSANKVFRDKKDENIISINKEDNNKKTNIMAVYIEQEDGSYQEVSEIPSSGYQVNTSKSTCSNGARPTGETPNITINNLSKNGTSCYLYFDKIEGQTIEDIIANTNYKTTTPDFSQAATTDEGVYQVSDGMYGGTSYYWRGAVTNNYVKFGGFCWRIIRINGDKTMRLIYDGTTCHANGTSTADSIAVQNVAYNTSEDRSEYVGYTYTTGSQRTLSGTASNLKIQNETWYNNNLSRYAEIIADGKYCNDRNTGSGYSWSSQPSSTFYYAGYDRSGAKSSSSVSPTLSCPSGDVYTLKIGAITADEVVMAGGKFENNTSYYLYNGQSYWTMSPYNWSNVSSYASVFNVAAIGRLNAHSLYAATPGVRPVINLKSDTLFQSGGTGTLENPYVVH